MILTEKEEREWQGIMEKHDKMMQRVYYEYESKQNTVRSGKCSSCSNHTDRLFEQNLCEPCFDEAIEQERELGIR
ncbi:F420H2 dehydrogenase subunit FpoO [Aneurinibacillus thermoaerophilus]|uniref:F420H2 dehydrogenase subunit FpoO n=1 Tax=Aneurinibacillus thermoaerophilus TaxID=143495 RepID=UPI002E21E630|nr:F420H2 dehydrogenase subunit FpoO [Aneurinibacillus thermoaerophilus]MED0765507.1 F420H2 dehydrogenase subunit FpoO [Aneurinibacillus thermoaerophilus]